MLDKQAPLVSIQQPPTQMIDPATQAWNQASMVEQNRYSSQLQSTPVAPVAAPVADWRSQPHAQQAFRNQDPGYQMQANLSQGFNSLPQPISQPVVVPAGPPPSMTRFTQPPPVASIKPKMPPAQRFHRPTAPVATINNRYAAPPTGQVIPTSQPANVYNDLGKHQASQPQHQPPYHQHHSHPVRPATASQAQPVQTQANSNAANYWQNQHQPTANVQSSNPHHQYGSNNKSASWNQGQSYSQAANYTSIKSYPTSQVDSSNSQTSSGWGGAASYGPIRNSAPRAASATPPRPQTAQRHQRPQQPRHQQPQHQQQHQPRPQHQQPPQHQQTWNQHTWNQQIRQPAATSASPARPKYPQNNRLPNPAAPQDWSNSHNTYGQNQSNWQQNNYGAARAPAPQRPQGGQYYGQQQQQQQQHSGYFVRVENRNLFMIKFA